MLGYSRFGGIGMAPGQGPQSPELGVSPSPENPTTTSLPDGLTREPFMISCQYVSQNKTTYYFWNSLEIIYCIEFKGFNNFNRLQMLPLANILQKQNGLLIY